MPTSTMPGDPVVTVARSRLVNTWAAVFMREDAAGGTPMPFVGGGHIWLLLIVLAIVLIIWGPGKLPDIGSGMGRAIREFRKATTEVRDQVTSVTATPDTPAPDGATAQSTRH